MPFELECDDELDFDEMFKDCDVSDENLYIADEEKAVELISELIKNEQDRSVYFRKKIENKINKMFALFSEFTLENEMLLYERFMELCSRLSEQQKIQKIKDKVVISFGGKVSSGKSKLINTISGIGDQLPVDQKTTTAIPTYIIKSDKDAIYANSVYGYSSCITAEALNAMAHEFYNTYGIGFPAFVDSIIVESSDYVLPSEIALLDTPGYTKYDAETYSKRVITDREKAFEQLSISDYLIWLIDIDSGAITEDDIRFIEDLKIKTPILIVFTKADLKSEEDIIDIINVAQETINNTGIDCFGITAYSAKTKTEYVNNKMHEFFNYAISENVRNSDIIKEFNHVETDMRNAINKAISQSKESAERLFTFITESEKIMDIKSLTLLWRDANKSRYKLTGLLKEYDSVRKEINREISKYFM